MLLSHGRVSAGIGGGLCQLSNLLYWLFLHGPLAILERHHHSVDAFPDSHRVLPFGSGATVLHNFVDLRARNVSEQPLQIKLWLTETHLKGQLRSTAPAAEKYHVHERHHTFVQSGAEFFRYNQLWRETRRGGVLTAAEQITTNFAPVVYPTSPAKIHAQGHSLITL